MSDKRTYEGCSDGNCLLRSQPMRQHTNGGCRCLVGLPTEKRVAVQREIERLKMGNAELETERNEALTQVIEILASLKRKQDKIERLRGILALVRDTDRMHAEEEYQKEE